MYLTSTEVHADAAVPKNRNERTVTIAEIVERRDSGQVWVVINGEVYE